MSYNFFNSGNGFYPYRWYLIIIAALTLGMSYADASGWRVMTFAGNQQRGYYGSTMGHK